MFGHVKVLRTQTVDFYIEILELSAPAPPPEGAIMGHFPVIFMFGFKSVLLMRIITVQPTNTTIFVIKVLM